jgi:hypothetical protein
MDPKSNDAKNGAPPSEGVSGEGNYEATRRYNKGLAESVEKGDADALAEKARKALEGPEGDELRKAEEEAKQGTHKHVAK